jgi:hypothetical protein
MSTVAVVRNPKAIGALFFGIAALAFLAAGAAVPRFVPEIEPLEALVVVPAAVVCALVSIGLARRARFEFQRSLGRAGGDGIAATGRMLSVIALLVSLTAALAVGVFAVLALVLD